MAGDLIPPPSPAGRPSPDAMRHLPRRATEHLEEAAAPESTAPPAAPPFRSRFGFALGALVGVAAAALVAFVVLLGTSSSKSALPAGLAAHWSEWNPPSNDVVGAPEAIANHVETVYKRADGKQLVSVHGGPFFYSGATTPLPFAVRLQPADGSIQDLGSNGVLYTLAGTGQSGTIVGDKPTPARLRLLRREALELALYTFRYVDHITMFVALLPMDPQELAKRKKTSSTAPPTLQALFFRPGDLKRQLQTPLASTLRPALKLGPTQLDGPEAKRVDKLTNGNLFKATFQQQFDGQLYLVLKRSD